jgi:hypothetical protein
MRWQPRWIALAAVALCGCTRVVGGERGNGRIEQQARAVSPFAEVKVSSGIRVSIVTGAQRVVVRADANLLPRLRTEVHNGRLTIRMLGRTQPTAQPEVELRSPWMRTIEASGASTVSAAGVTGDDWKREVQLTAAGKSRITARGSCLHLTAQAAGGSLVDVNDLIARDVEATASGGSTVRVFASASVAAHASGASTVQVAGHPRAVRREAAGTSSVLVE